MASEERISWKREPRVVVRSPEDPAIRHLSWPKLVRAPDGALVLAYSAGRGHNIGGSGLAVSHSEDGGETFSPPQLLCYFPRDDARYRDVGNLALGLGDDGAVILLAMAFHGDRSHTILGWRSTDHGRTWRRTDTADLGENRTGSVFGHVFAVPGRGLAVCGHFRRPKGDGLWIAYSQDDGRSWTAPQIISDQRFFEPVFVHTRRTLVGLAREDEAHAYHQFVSRDLGATWTFSRGAVQGDPRAAHPSPFLAVDPADPGRLLALVSERAPAHQVSLWESPAETVSWRRVGLVTRGEGDWTYPWMTHLGGDQWYLVYYQGTGRSASIYGARLAISRPNPAQAPRPSGPDAEP